MQTLLMNDEGFKSIELPQYPNSAWTFYSEKPKDDDEALFGLVAMLYSAVNITADALVDLPYSVFTIDGEEPVDESNDWKNTVGFMPNPDDLLRRWRMSLSFTNAAYGFMESSKGSKLLRYIVADTITPETNSDRGRSDTGVTSFLRKVGNQQIRYPYEQGSKKNRVIPLWWLDHMTELLPTENTEFRAAANSAGIIYYTDFFVEHFFKRGGVVPSLIGLKGAGANSTQREEIERGIHKIMKNVYKYITKLVNADMIEITPLGSSVEVLQDNNSYKQAIENIAIAFRMPLSIMLANSANFATSQEEKRTWYNNKIFPDAKRLQYVLNQELFNPYGYRFEFMWEASDEGTEEEVERAQSINTFMDFLVKAPSADIATETALTFGYELSDGLITAINTYFSEQKEKEEMQQEEINQEAQVVAEEVPIRSVSELKELKVWQDVAQRHLRKRKSLDFDYVAHYGGVSPDLYQEVKTKLVTCKTKEDITAVFDGVVSDTEPPVYEEQPEVKALAEALNRLAEKDEQQPITVNLSTPQSFTLNEKDVTITPELKQEPPTITVNVPDQPAPNVNVVNQVETPEVNIKNEVLPAPVKVTTPKEAEIIRDADGRAKGIRTK